MVKIMKNPIKMDDLGGTSIFGNTHMESKVGWICDWLPKIRMDGWKVPPTIFRGPNCRYPEKGRGITQVYIQFWKKNLPTQIVGIPSLKLTARAPEN